MIKFKSIICLNGNLPARVFFGAYPDLPIIAADGAGERLIELGVMPHYIIGDFDSCRLKAGQYPEVNFIKIIDQNKTDFEKSITKAEGMDLFPALICGMFGGEIDHLLNNVRCFMRYSQKQALFFYDQEENGAVKYGRGLIAIKQPVIFEFSALKDELISIIPFDKSIVSTSGLRWNLKNDILSLDGMSTIRNKAIGRKVTIELSQGQIILISSRILV